MLNQSRNLHTIRVLVAMGLLLAIFIAIHSASLPVKADGTIVSVSPASQTVATSGTVNIVVTDVVALYGADVKLTFDPAIAAVRDANGGQSGVQITPGPLLTSGSGGYFFTRNTADNTLGTIRFALTQLADSDPVTGSGVLATITFDWVTNGTSPINFNLVDGVRLSDRNGIQIPATAQNGSITFAKPTAVTLSSLTVHLDGLTQNDWVEGLAVSVFGIMVAGSLWGLRRARQKR